MNSGSHYLHFAWNHRQKMDVGDLELLASSSQKVFYFVARALSVFLHLAPDWPQNAQAAAHFAEFLTGYKPDEAVRVKFLRQPADRKLLPCTVGYVDGFCKVLIMVAVVTFIYELEPWLNTLLGSTLAPCVFICTWTKEWTEDVLNRPEVRSLLRSFRWIRCSYTYAESPTYHSLLSLSALFAKSCSLESVHSSFKSS